MPYGRGSAAIYCVITYLAGAGCVKLVNEIESELDKRYDSQSLVLIEICSDYEYFA